MAIMDFIEASRFDGHLFTVKQAGKSGLARFGALALAKFASPRIVRLIVSRLLVGSDVAFIVTDNDFMVRHAEQIVRHDRDLSASAGGIHNILWNGIAGGMSAQALDDLNALGDRRAEVPCAFDEITLIEIIRSNADARQLLYQFALNVNAIVDPRQQADALDELITVHSENWRIERLAAIDRAILRLAAHELRAGK